MGSAYALCHHPGMKPRFALLPALVLLLALTGNARAGTTVARWVELAPPPLFDGGP